VPVYLATSRYLKRCNLNSPAKLVDLGCGTGRDLSYLKSTHPQLEIWGVDYSHAVVQYARKHYSRPGLIFARSDATAPDEYPDSAFDFVVSSHVMEHLKREDARRFLAQSFRLLKSGGYLFVGTPERRHWQDLYFKNIGDKPAWRLFQAHEHEYTLTELKSLARDIFRPEKVVIHKLSNPMYHEIFLASINKIKPGFGVVNVIRRTLLQESRRLCPRRLFDLVVRTGMQTALKLRKMTWYDLLRCNRIDSEERPGIADNLFLVCRK